MSRVSYNMLKQWVDEWWNENRPEYHVKVRSYNDWVRIAGPNGDEFIVDKTPGKVWEAFRVWMNGYHLHERLIEEGKIQVLKAKGQIKC